jgi:hypothetical protein
MTRQEIEQKMDELAREYHETDGLAGNPTEAAIYFSTSPTL